MKETSDRIIYISTGVIVLFGVLSFFFAPAYEKGAWAVISVAVMALTNTLSFKFGVHVSKPIWPDPVPDVSLPQAPVPALNGGSQ
jgi:hypothetical protein